MRIGLCDVDSHNFPNLPLMKLSAYHKAMGDQVEWWSSEQPQYDKVYASKVFTESVMPDIRNTDELCVGGSGIDLTNKLPYDVEHTTPDYALYPQYNFALGWLTRGCPRRNHAMSCGGFCLTPDKDGCVSTKTADLKEFWTGQKNIHLLDQNLLACKDRFELLEQLARSKARVCFDGGSDVRYMTDDVIDALREVRVTDYHFAWDDPKENLFPKFVKVAESGLVKPKYSTVYVLTNFWSTHEEDLDRIYKLRILGFVPYVMIYDKQKFVDARGRLLPNVREKFSEEQICHFKLCQHLQRWVNNRSLFMSCAKIEDYERYRNFLRSWKGDI